MMSPAITRSLGSMLPSDLRRGVGCLATLVLVVLGATRALGSPVRTNQVGYTPTEAKWVAVAPVSGTPATFEVRRASDNGLVMSGPLTLRRASDAASGDNVYQGHFGGLSAPGDYFVRVPGVGDSHPFLIHPGIWDDLFRRFMKGLYYQRCGTAITAEHGGAYTHEACHDEGGAVASHDWVTTGGAPGGYRNTIGGWHDAGDYGKYSTNNAYAVGLLLQAYDQFPSRYAYDNVGIPESGNGVPDLLDEMRWGLAWMHKMQLAAGSVLHRESIANYAGEFLPESETTSRYYTSISSDATAVHAAAMALAARVFAPFDAAFAATCSSSAVAAWAWLESHASRVPLGGFTNLHGHTGATYIAGSETGRRLWAAAEIFRLTGSASAKGYFDARWGEGKEFNGVWYPDGWGDLANVGAFAYRDASGATPSIKSGNWWSIENSALSSAADWTNRAAQDGYGCVAATSPPNGDYYWGFTGVILRYAWTLLEAHRYSGDPDYEEAAREQLHYVLGRNPMDKVYVTGIGERPVLHSHGAWNLAAGFVQIDDATCHPVPYQLVGGPNRADNSDISAWPGKCYEDIADPDYSYKGNYTLNETALNIQAALIALTGYFSSGGVVTGVTGEGEAATSRIVQAAPNPFRVGTTLRWNHGSGDRHAAGADVADAVRIFDISGRHVRELVGRPVAGHAFEARWDGRNADGTIASPGIYWASPVAPGARSSRIVRLGR